MYRFNQLVTELWKVFWTGFFPGLVFFGLAFCFSLTKQMENKIYVILLKDSNYKKEISLGACKLCGLMKDMLGEETYGELPLDTLTPKIMDKVLEFLEYHANNPMISIETPIKTKDIKSIVGDWDTQFIDLKNDQGTLMELILAANYLNCQNLLDLGLLKIAAMIKDEEPDKVKKMFSIDRDLSPEEEVEIRKQNGWLFT